jgi:peptidoglycan/xylan/chitin deacetylase (PgdA/CDA1 family)
MTARALASSLIAVVIALAITGTHAQGADCPGHPEAIGTSRTLVVDPIEHPRIGTMQYAETLPLEDHEVVLTFDDGPLPPHSTQVLDILAAQCVKATFFIIGRMAHERPDGVRKVRDAGHTIGTHSENHPLSFNRMSADKAVAEIDQGIAHVKEALGNANDLAPFFRIPGLLRAEAVESELAARGLQTWSADFPADDWRPISSARVAELALSRIEAKGKGVLLLHDIQARTVAALPVILRELKARGYRIVHVVPATPERPKTPTTPEQWRLKPEAAAIAAAWPPVPAFKGGAAPILPAPALTPDLTTGSLSITTQRVRPRDPGTVPLPPIPLWPHHLAGLAPAATSTLPAPASNLFRTLTAKRI